MEKLKKESKNLTHIRGVLHYFNFAKKFDDANEPI